MEEYRMGDWIETYTGGRFWPCDPRPAEVNIVDIAQALSMICRYNGQVKYFYSVGQHSILCALLARRRNLGPRIELLALLHDAAEAYMCDATPPVKKGLVGFKTMERRIQQAIYEAFEIRPPSDQEQKTVKELDLTMRATEAREIKVNGKEWRQPFPPTDEVRICPCLLFADIRDLFLGMFQRLIKWEREQQGIQATLPASNRSAAVGE